MSMWTSLRAKTTTLLFILQVLLPRPLHCLKDVVILNDATSLVGRNASLACRGTGVFGRILDCSWKSPSSIVYSQNDLANHLRGVRVSLFESSHYCLLNVDSVSFEMSGAWECILEDEEHKPLGKFAFLRVFDPMAEDFQVISSFDEQEKSVIAGSDASLICKANHVVKKIQERATCIWIDPNGKTFDVIGSRGEVYEYWPDGIVSIGNPDEGECGIKLKNARATQSGLWTCQLIRKSPKGIGSQVTTGVIDLEVLRSARYELEDSIQGFFEGEVDVTISITLEHPSNAHAISFFWIIQRKYLIYEGDQWFCPGDARVCYLPKPRRAINEYNAKTVILDLVVSEVTRADLNEPIILIMEYIDKTSNKNVYSYISKIFKVPKRRDHRRPRQGIKDNDKNTTSIIDIKPL